MRGTWKGLVSVVIVPDEEEDERGTVPERLW